MSDRFPYNLPSRAALCRLIREKPIYRDIKDDLVTFEDMFHAPVGGVPGRTFIEMIDLSTQIKSWFVFRRLDLKMALTKNSTIKIIGTPTPKAIAEEINRSRGMTFGPDDISFSTTPLVVKGDQVEYTLKAMLGSYAYYGECTITVSIVTPPGSTRLLEDGSERLLEDGTVRQLEQWVN